MNTKIHKLLVFILATSSVLSPIASYADQTAVIRDSSSILPDKDAQSKNIFDLNNAIFTPDGSGITLVFGANATLEVRGSADQIKTIDLNGWSSEQSPIKIDLDKTINSTFNIVNKAQEYKFSDNTAVGAGGSENAVIILNTYANQTFSDVNNQLKLIKNVIYGTGNIDVTLDCGYDNYEQAVANSIATTFTSNENNSKVTFNQPGKHIVLSGKNKGVNFTLAAGTMELTNKNRGDVLMESESTLVLGSEHLGTIEGGGNLFLKPGAIVDDINQDQGSITVIDAIEGKTATIKNSLKTKTINIEKGAKLKVINCSIEANSLNFADDKGELIYKSSSTLVPISAQTNSMQTLKSGICAANYTAKHDVNSKLTLVGANLNIEDNVNLNKEVILNKEASFETQHENNIRFEGRSTINKDITSKIDFSSEIILNENSQVTTAPDVKIHAPVVLGKDSILTIGQGGDLLSASTKVAEGGQIIASFGSTIGDIGAYNLPIEKFTAEDVNLSGTIYNAKVCELSGTNILTTTKPSVEIYNLKTQPNTIIDATKTQLKISGKETRLDQSTTIKLTLAPDALIFEKSVENNNFDRIGLEIHASNLQKQFILQSATINQILEGQKFNVVGGAGMVIDKAELVDKIEIIPVEKSLFSYKLTTNTKNLEEPILEIYSSDRLKNIMNTLFGPISGEEKIHPFLAQMLVDADKNEVSKVKQQYAPANIKNVAYLAASSIHSALANYVDSAKQVSAGSDDYKPGTKLFVMPLLGAVKELENGDIAVSKASIGGVILGAAHSLADQKTDLGLAISVAASNFKLPNNNTNNDSVKSKINAFSAFVNHELVNKILLDAVVTYHSIQTDFTSARFKYQGKQDNNLLFVAAKVGREVELNNTLKVTPYTGGRFTYFTKKDTDYSGLKFANFTKKDTGDSGLEFANITSNPENQQQVIGLIGAKLSAAGQYRSLYLEPFVDINIGFNFASSLDQGSIIINVDNTKLPMSFSHKNKNRVIISTRFGMQANINNSFYTTLSGGLDWFVNSIKAMSFSIKVGYRF